MAINYTKIGWDTSKYVNPTNMNQMDDGIKAACDGVDAISANYIKVSDSNRQTITNTSSDLAMALKGNSTSKTLLSFIGSNGTTFGHIGVNSSKKPIFNSGTAENEIALKDNYPLQTTIGNSNVIPSFSYTNFARVTIVRQGFSYNCVVLFEQYSAFVLASGTLPSELSISVSNKTVTFNGTLGHYATYVIEHD